MRKRYSLTKYSGGGNIGDPILKYKPNTKPTQDATYRNPNTYVNRAVLDDGTTKSRMEAHMQQLRQEQPQLKKARVLTPYEKATEEINKKHFVATHPYTRLEGNNIIAINHDRGFDGQPLTPNAERLDKGLEHVMGAIDAATIVAPALGLAGRGLKAAGRYLTEETLLKNASKLNPLSYSNNLPKNVMWRGIGKEGAADALESGVFRAKQNVEPLMDPTHGKFDMSKQFKGTYYSPKFKTADQYGKGFIAEVPNDATTFRARYGKKQWSQIADENIPIEKGKILQKDWWKGYKEVPKNKPGEVYWNGNSYQSTPLSDVTLVTKNIEKSSAMPQSISELSNTGFRNDPSYHLNSFNKKKKNILEHISTPEGRKRIQNYIDNNSHLRHKTVDDVIENFNKTEFVTEIPKWKGEINKDGYSSGDWIRDEYGDEILFPVNPNNAFNWYKNGYNKPSLISMGQNHTPYDAQHILEHEFAHLFQGASEIKGVDNELANISLKTSTPIFFNMAKFKKYNPLKKTYVDQGFSVTKDIYGYNNPLNSNLRNHKNYWLTGAGLGREKAAFAAEVRENLLQRGFIKNRYDEITPELLKEHYNVYKNTIGDKYNLRIYDIMNKNPKNFKYLSTALNRLPGLMPYAIPTAIGVGSLQQKKQGGIINNSGWLNKYKQ